jgi:hypothetical protein
LKEVRISIGNSYKELQLKRKMLSAKAIKDLYLGAEQEVYALSRLFKYHNETSLTRHRICKRTDGAGLLRTVTVKRQNSNRYHIKKNI